MDQIQAAPAAARGAPRNTMNPHSWMRDLPASARQAKLTDLILPGSHDSAAYRFTAEHLDQYQTPLVRKIKAAADWMKRTGGPMGFVGTVTDKIIAKSVSDWGKAQNLDIYGQLDGAGIRWLDLRVMVYEGGLYLYHGFVAVAVEDILDQIRRFSDKEPDEIVILSFSHMDTLAPARLAQLIQDRLGQAALCVESDLARSIEDLQAGGKRFVAFYDAAALPPGYPWLLRQGTFYKDLPVKGHSSVEGLVSDYDEQIAAYKGPLPMRTGFTTTPETSDIVWSIVNQFNPFTGTHDLRWFTNHARETLPLWMEVVPGRIGIVSSDFVDGVDLIGSCLARMKIEPPRSPTSVIAPVGATPISSGFLQWPFLYVLDAGGRLWLNSAASSKSWTDLGRPSFGATIQPGPAAAVTVNKTLGCVYVLGDDGHLWHNRSFQGWVDLGTPPTENPGLELLIGVTTVDPGSTDKGRPHSFVKGTDKQLWRHTWDDAGPHWDHLGWPPSGSEIDLPLGATTANFQVSDGGFPYAYMRTQDGNVWQWDGFHNGWQILGTPPSVAIVEAVGVTTVNDSPHAYALGSDGQLWYNRYDGQSWNWLPIEAPPDGVKPDMVIGLGCAAGVAHCYVRGSDGNGWVHFSDGTQEHWVGLSLPADGVGIALGLQATAVGDSPQAFVLGSDGNVYLNRWEGDGVGFRWLPLGGEA